MTLVLRFLLLTVFTIACGSIPNPGPPALIAGAGGLYADAAIFGPVLSLVGGARHEILVEMYEFGRSDVLSELEQASVRCVAVRVLLDPTLAVTSATGAALSAAGLAVRWYPVDATRAQIDHVKLLVADGVALVGGMNWGPNSARNHDYALLLNTVAAVARARDIFEQDWALAAANPPAATAPIAAGLAQTAPGEGIRSVIADLLARARHEISAELFELTDPDIGALLATTHRAGVMVRIILDANQAFSREAARLLAAAGVEVRWYRAPSGGKLHAKAALIDRTLLLGSANWTAHGLSINHELDAETSNPAAVAAYRARFETDWSASG